VQRIASSAPLATVELSREDAGSTHRIEVTVFREYLRQLGVQEGDRVRLKPKRVHVFPAGAAAAPAFEPEYSI
jgi:hypothetical protein